MAKIHSLKRLLNCTKTKVWTKSKPHNILQEAAQSSTITIENQTGKFEINFLVSYDSGFTIEEQQVRSFFFN